MLDELNKAEAKAAGLAHDVAKAEQRARFQTLTAPVDGVVQQLASIPVYEFPVVGPDGRVHVEPFYTVMGFAPTRDGLAVLGRGVRVAAADGGEHPVAAQLLAQHHREQGRIDPAGVAHQG